MTSRLVIAVRVSCGHLCGAEAPTEPAGETAARRVAIRLSSKGITDSFVLRTQNDRFLVIASTVRCAAIRFSPLKNTAAAPVKPMRRLYNFLF